MTDQSNESRPAEPLPTGFEVLDSGPSVGWVVHEIRTPRASGRTMWAWCRVIEGEPGYANIDKVTFNDGVTEAEPPATIELGPIVVKLWC